MSLFEFLQANNNDFTDHDLAHLADWANDWKNNTPNPHWKRAYSLIREGADLLLRRRAMSRMVPVVDGPKAVHAQTPFDYADLRKAIDDYKSTFYGPQQCGGCGRLVVKQGTEYGTAVFDADDLKSATMHRCQGVPQKELPCPPKMKLS